MHCEVKAMPDTTKPTGHSLSPVNMYYDRINDLTHEEYPWMMNSKEN